MEPDSILLPRKVLFINLQSGYYYYCSKIFAFFLSGSRAPLLLLMVGGQQKNELQTCVHFNDVSIQHKIIQFSIQFFNKKGKLI